MTLSMQIGSLGRHIRRRVKSEWYRRHYHDPGPNEFPTAMLLGTARSGTTWVAEVIDSQVPCRLMFEPFNPDRVREFSRFEYFQYMRPDDEHPELLSFCTQLVAGALRGRWVDRHLEHLAPSLRLVKDIRATLMLRWFHDCFPHVPLLFLLRHPCAVVLSRIRLQWATDVDVRRLLCQPKLVGDHLGPYLDVIERAKTDEEKHAVVWCVSNLVPLRQFTSGGLTVLYYESLRDYPDTELPRVFGTLGVPFDSSVFAALARPSRTSRHGAAPVSIEPAWTRALTPGQIERVLAVVRAFGLDHVYNEGTAPCDSAPRCMVRHDIGRVMTRSA